MTKRTTRRISKKLSPRRISKKLNKLSRNFSFRMKNCGHCKKKFILNCDSKNRSYRKFLTNTIKLNKKKNRKKSKHKKKVLLCEDCFSICTIKTCKGKKIKYSKFCENCAIKYDTQEYTNYVFNSWDIKDGCINNDQKTKFKCKICKDNGCIYYMPGLKVCYMCYFEVRKIIYLKHRHFIDINKLIKKNEFVKYNLVCHSNYSKYVNFLNNSYKNTIRNKLIIFLIKYYTGLLDLNE